MQHADSIRKRATRAVLVSVGIVLAFVATWYFIARAVQGGTLESGFMVSGTSGPAPLAVTVTNTDYQLTPNTRLEVDFGDGTVVKNPEGDNRGSVKITTIKHTYVTEGRYTLTMTKRVPKPAPVPGSPPDSVQVVSTPVIVSKPEPLEFYLYPAQGHAPLTVFAGLVDHHLFPDMQVRFDFGDGTVLDTNQVTKYNSGSVQFLSARHSYLRPGLYTATATLSSPSLGFTQSANQPVLVDDQDGISFLAQLDSPSQPLRVTVIAKDSDRFCDGSPITGCKGLSWIFGDGTTVADAPASVTHQFPKAGTYKITLDLRSTLRTEKLFTIDGKGGLVEVKVPPAAITSPPKLTTIRVNGSEVALASSITISASDTLQLRGSGTPGTVVRGTLVAPAGFTILTEPVAEHTDQFLVNPEGQWVWQPLSFLPKISGTFTLFLQEKEGSARQQVLAVTVTAPPSAAAPSDPSQKNKAPEKASGSSSKRESNQAEIVPTAVTATGFKGTLVATGSNLPLMLLLSLLVAAAASYFILRNPDGSLPHLKVHDQ